MDDLFNSFRMNRATPHLEAWSSLRTIESSNRRGQPKMGTALTSEWKASTRMSQYMGRAKKALVRKQRHPMTMEHQRGGDLYFKSGKDACIAHICLFVTIKSKKKKSSKIKKNREKRIIELIIKENHYCDLGTERKMRRTLPLGNFQKKKKTNENLWAGCP